MTILRKTVIELKHILLWHSPEEYKRCKNWQANKIYYIIFTPQEILYTKKSKGISRFAVGLPIPLILVMVMEKLVHLSEKRNQLELDSELDLQIFTYPKYTIKNDGKNKIDIDSLRPRETGVNLRKRSTWIITTG